jgi:transposase-like protein
MNRTSRDPTDPDVCSWHEHATSVGEVAQTLLGVAPSASTISRLNQSLTQQFAAWRQRPLQEHWRIVYLDGIHFSIRHGDKADSTIILTALGVELAGNKEVLALRACAQEDKDGWACLLHDLRSRGATHIDLIVTDGHDGLLAAVSQLFSATPRQRWQVAQATHCVECHSSTRARRRAGRTGRNLGATDKTGGTDPTGREHSPNMANAIGEAVRSLAEEEEKTLTFYEFPQAMHRHIQTTHAIESLAEQCAAAD